MAAYGLKVFEHDCWVLGIGYWVLDTGYWSRHSASGFRIPHSAFHLQKALSADFALCCSLFFSSSFSISMSRFKF
jgi:hypothetical protein